MSWGSIHSCRGRILLAADPGGIEQILDVVVEALGFVAHHAGERVQPLVLRDHGGFAQHRRGAEDRRQRRAQFMRHRADQRLPQQLGLGTHLRIIERARDVEPLERGRGIRQHVVHPMANLLHRPRRNAAEIDGDDAEVGVLLRNATDQPDVAGAVVHGGRKRAAGADLGDRRMHALRQSLLLRLDRAIAVGDRSEQHHLALDQAREMLLDREIDVGGRRRRCQAAREGIEITHVLFAFAGNLGMLLHGICEVARHHGNDHEQQQIENLVRTGEVEAVVRREEKISRPQHAGDGGDQRRHQPEMPPREQHREQIDDGAPAHVERLDQHVGNERGRGHQHQSEGTAAQFTSNRFHSNHGSSSGAGIRRDGMRQDSPPQPPGHPFPIFPGQVGGAFRGGHERPSGA